MREFIFTVCILFFGVAAFLGAGFAIVYPLYAWECNGYQSATGLNTEMINGTCYIEDPKYGWMTKEERTLSYTAERLKGVKN